MSIRSSTVTERIGWLLFLLCISYVGAQTTNFFLGLFVIQRRTVQQRTTPIKTYTYNRNIRAKELLPLLPVLTTKRATTKPTLPPTSRKSWELNTSFEHLLPHLKLSQYCPKSQAKPTPRDVTYLTPARRKQLARSFAHPHSHWRILPFYRDQKPAGIKIMHVQRKSLLHDLGLRSGDILLGINGQSIETPSQAIELYRKTPRMSHYCLSLVRRRKNKTLLYLKAESFFYSEYCKGYTPAPLLPDVRVHGTQAMDEFSSGMMGQLMVRALPYTEKGKIKGIRYAWVSRQSKFWKLGFRAGDILVGINNRPVYPLKDKDPSIAMNVYIPKATTHLCLSLLRNKQPQTWVQIFQRTP